MFGYFPQLFTPIRPSRSVVLGNNSDIFFHVFFPSSGCHNIGLYSRVLAGSLKMIDKTEKLIGGTKSSSEKISKIIYRWHLFI